MADAQVRKRGDRYEVRWRIVDERTGKVRRRSKSFTRKADARRFAAEMHAAVASGTYAEPSTITVAELADEWLKVRKTQLRPATWSSYERQLACHVLPAFGHVRVVDLKPAHLSDLYATMLESGRLTFGNEGTGRPAKLVQAAQRAKRSGSTWQEIADMLAERWPEHGPYSRHTVAGIVRRADEPPAETKRAGSGLSPRYVGMVHTLCKRMLKDAVRWSYVDRNVAELVDPPRRTSRPEMVTWTGEQVAAFLAHCEADDAERLTALWHLLASTGMRRGEALALRWSSVDLEQRTLVIERSLTETKGELHEHDPKTAAGRRRISLDDDVVAALKRHRKAQAAERLRIGSLYVDDGRVFCQVDGTALKPESVSRRFVVLVKRAGLPKLSVHGLRHTWATLAMAAGVPAKVVQEHLGHTHITITLQTYSHVSPGMDRDAVDLVASLFRRQS